MSSNCSLETLTCPLRGLFTILHTAVWTYGHTKGIIHSYYYLLIDACMPLHLNLVGSELQAPSSRQVTTACPCSTSPGPQWYSTAEPTPVQLLLLVPLKRGGGLEHPPGDNSNYYDEQHNMMQLLITCKL